MSFPFGAFLDTAANIAGFQHADEQQDDAQAYNYFRWQEQTAREDTAHRREVHDLKMAGLNPMLTMMHRGAPSSPAPASPALMAHGQSHMQEGFASAAQIELNRALTDKTEAEAENIRARTHQEMPVNIERMRQEINQSIEQIENIRQQVQTGRSSAAHFDQQVRNLQETLPQIRAATRQLDALTKLNEAQAIERLTASGVNEAQAKEILQRVKQNLPELERALMALEKTQMEMAQPGHMANEAAQSSYIGQLGAYLRALIPLQGVMGAIPMGRFNRSTPTPSTPIHRGTGNRPDIHRR